MLADLGPRPSWHYALGAVLDVASLTVFVWAGWWWCAGVWTWMICTDSYLQERRNGNQAQSSEEDGIPRPE
jgi:hypothetical protein